MRKKLVAVALTMALAICSATSAFAAGSVQTAPAANDYAVSATAKNLPNDAKVTVAASTTMNGVTTKVTGIGAEAVGDQTKTLITEPGVVKFKKDAFKNAKALKVIKIKCKKGAKAKSYSISKKSFQQEICEESESVCEQEYEQERV